MNYSKIIHHGAVDGVTGSCQELQVDLNNSVFSSSHALRGNSCRDALRSVPWRSAS